MKLLKIENKKLVEMLKESDVLMSQRHQQSKLEMDQILAVLNKIWPLILKSLQVDMSQIDNDTREVI